MSLSSSEERRNMQKGRAYLMPRAAIEPAAQARPGLMTDESKGWKVMAMCPKLCGGQLRQVNSSRWGRYWRCRSCGYECRHASWHQDR
jgi:hypothetical protein